jgi:ABC-type amino acid transport substrate-binding protein
VRAGRLLLVTLFWIAALPAGAEAPVLSDLQQVIAAGKLVVALGNEDIDPMVSVDAKGRLGGFDVDLSRALAGLLGVKAEFRRAAKTPDQIIGAVARGEADIGISLLSATAARAKHVLFTRPYARQLPTALVNRSGMLQFRGRCPTSAEVVANARKPGRVGVQLQGAAAGWIREKVPDAELAEFAGLEELFAAARAGTVMLTIQGEIPARRLLHEHPAASIQLRMCVLDARPDYIAIAVRPNAPGLARWIDAFLQERSVFYDAEALGRREGTWRFGIGDPLRK